MNDYRQAAIKTLTEVISLRKTYISKSEAANLARKIERACNNTNVENSERKGIPCYWNDSIFHEYYQITVAKIAYNIDNSDYLIARLEQYIISKRWNEKILNHPAFVRLSEKAKKIIIEDMGNKGISPSVVPSLSSKELDPHKNKSLYDELEMKSNITIERKTSKIYKCRNCGKRENFIEKRQTRGLDEPETIFVECANCGAKWVAG